MKLASLDQRFVVETIAAARGVPAAIAFELAAETQEVAMDQAYMEDEAMRLPSVATGASAEACCSEKTSGALRKAGVIGGARDRRRLLIGTWIARRSARQGIEVARYCGVQIARRTTDVGLEDSFLRRRVGPLSGGQAQRVAIARAIATRPRLIILDEPSSSLDVSVQAQILNLLVDLQARNGFACLFITHDLDVVRFATDKVAVMESGAIVEAGTTERVLESPRHGYTARLVAATPRLPARADGHGDEYNPR